MQKITLNRLQEFGDVYKAIEFAKTQYPSYPARPSRPVLKNNATSTEAKEYATLLEAYEQKQELYRTEKDEYQKQTNAIDSVIAELIKDDSGLNTIVPQQYRDKVYGMAWSLGHSSGYTEVYQYLNDLVEIFDGK